MGIRDRHKLGSSRGAAFDLQAVCSGFVYAVATADNFLARGQFERALVIDPNRTDSLLWLGNIYRSESNFTEAIRLHQQAHRIEERNVEVLLELAKDLEGARRYEDALQTLQNILRIEPDNLMALIRKRDLQIRLEKWSDALEIQHRLVKANLPESERRAESNLLLGCMYEVGRQLLERGHPDKARRYFRGAIKKDRTFLPAYIGIGEILVREGKTKNAVEILKKIYAKTRRIIILNRMEELFLELGEPDESGRRRPVPVKGSEFVIEVDTVVIAIGNNPNPLIPRSMPDLATSKWGTIIVDETTMATSVPGVFAAGDIVSGAATVISAMGQARTAAATINKYLHGEEIVVPKPA